MTISDTGFWSGDTAHEHHGHSPELAAWLVEYLQKDKATNIYDLGCGVGYYLQKLKEAGYERLTGIEGDPPAQKLFASIEQRDLAHRLEVSDWVPGVCICLEVGEHVPVRYESVLLDNIAALAKDKIILSWAIRGQGGRGHVNCLDNAEVIERLARRGFVYLEQDSRAARRAATSAAVPWFQNTLMIFRRHTMLEHFYQKLPGYFTFQDFYRWLAREFPEGHGVEVGSFAGRSAAFLAVELHNAAGARTPRLDLVDTFVPGYTPGPEGVRASLVPVAHIIGDIHQALSWDGAEKYADSSLDFVYIDADHHYVAVKRDIAAWLPKVRSGGIIAGHDFCNYPDFGVIEAVMEEFDRVDVWRGERLAVDGIRPPDRFGDGLGWYLPSWSTRVECAEPRPLHMTIVTTALNKEKWVRRCIESVQKQTFQNWTQIFIDAKSDDRTFEIAVQASKTDRRTIVQFDSLPKGALENAVETWNVLPDDEIVVWLDGDDWLAHDRALEVLAGTYANPDVWMTYGQLRFYGPSTPHDGHVSRAVAYPPGVAPRQHIWNATHLKTFRAGLVKKIKPGDLHKPDGSWCDLAVDHVVMFPLLEMATDQHHRFISQVLCVYNLESSTELSHTPDERTRELAEVTRLRALPVYQPLGERPW